MAARTNGAGPRAKFELPMLDLKLGSLTDGTDIPPPLPSPTVEACPAAAATPPLTLSLSPSGGDQPLGHASPPSHAPKTSSTSTVAGTAGPAGTKRASADAADHPSSPTLSQAAGRPGSIRRLFSRNLLSGAYAEGEAAAAAAAMATATARSSGDVHGQPLESRTNAGFVDGGGGRKAKRSSGWFSRLRSNSGRGMDAAEKRQSMLTMAPPPLTQGAGEKKVMVEVKEEDRGPAPPRIPELSELKHGVVVGGEGSLGGGEMFKDIN
ncbi:hypothetical protein P8C59_009165 [Phyllachora maydis]|uniref:Uncharacterized protein n=1 Tax=Phyllachora maydis TaxID=1825666 RepID=A0AAD9MFY4_9PEZI|nr:hypothetical protein P8C59_009165 [Phyllachora maydis]